MLVSPAHRLRRPRRRRARQRLRLRARRPLRQPEQGRQLRLAQERQRLPNQPEDFDGFQDQDGCPDPDNDGDGIPDINDQCPNDPENFNGVEDEDGYPEIVASEYTVPLYAVWNNVSYGPPWNAVNGVLRPASAGDAGDCVTIQQAVANLTAAGVLNVVWLRVNLIDGWMGYDPDAPPGVNDLGDLCISDLLWVNVDVDIIWTQTIPGTADPENTSPVSSASWSLYSVWNNVAWIVNACTPIGEAMSNLSNEPKVAWRWLNPQQSWLGYDSTVPPAINNLAEICPGDHTCCQ